MARALGLALAVLLAAAAPRAAQAQLTGSGATTVSFALTLRVPKERWEESLAETKMIWEFAKEKNVGSNVELLLRAAYEKVNGTIVAVREKQAKDAAEAAEKAAAPKVHRLTEPYEVKDGAVQGEAVRPLKPSAAAPKGTVRQYTLPQLLEKVEAHKLNLEQPFIVKDGVSNLDYLRERYTAASLMNDTSFKLAYYTPADAKAKRTFDTAEEQQKAEEEKYKPHMITFEKYFGNCFNHKAKPDFRKQPGTSTEHCEQFVSAPGVSAEMGDYSLDATAGLGWMAELDSAKAAFVRKRAKAFASMLPEGTDVAKAFSPSGGGGSRLFSLGPSGSGEEMRQESTAFVDGLIHGRRRWLFMEPKNFIALRESAREVLEPASGFMFFEQQLGELIEDFGLGAKGKKYWEINQEVGDLLYVPPSLVRVSVNLEDSFSYFERLHTSQATAQKAVDGNIWAPASGRIPDGYGAAACFGWDMVATADALGGAAPGGMQGQIIAQLMQQNFGGSVEQANYLILKVLAECASAIDAPSVNAARTMCAAAWVRRPQAAYLPTRMPSIRLTGSFLQGPCAQKLEANLGTMGVDWPDVLPRKVTVEDTGDTEAQKADKDDVGLEEEADEQEGKKKKKGKKEKKKKKKGKK